jgi:hypothetical protein
MLKCINLKIITYVLILLVSAQRVSCMADEHNKPNPTTGRPLSTTKDCPCPNTHKRRNHIKYERAVHQYQYFWTVECDNCGNVYHYNYHLNECDAGLYW